MVYHLIWAMYFHVITLLKFFLSGFGSKIELVQLTYNPISLIGQHNFFDSILIIFFSQLLVPLVNTETNSRLDRIRSFLYI